MELQQNQNEYVSMVFSLPEILKFIASFIPNETFNLSKVSKSWMTALNEKILFKKMTSWEITVNEKYNIIESLRNDSYALSIYIKSYKVISFLDVKTINSSKCLDILTWNMYNSTRNKLTEPTRCGNCGSITCGNGKSGDLELCKEMLEQYCVMNGTLKYASELMSTLENYDACLNSTLDMLENVCIVNKSHEMKKLIQSKKMVRAMYN